ncbi:MAG: cyclic nucleotide-binding domain-containing protein [Acidimicrobiales bacterium]
MRRIHDGTGAAALDMKEVTVRSLADGKDYVGMLEDIPLFSSCTRNVLEAFVALGVTTVECPAGETLSPDELHDQNLCVLIAGSVLLSAGDGVVVSLEPGDYFGRTPVRYSWLTASAVATSDAEVLVISPQELTMLMEASCRDRHPSQVEWRLELPAPARHTARKPRPAALAS